MVSFVHFLAYIDQ